DIALFGGEIEILTQKRLAQFDRGPSLAYAARAKGETFEGYFALICENHLVPRSMSAAKFANIITPGLVRLIASGVVYWPPADGERYVFVCESTVGDPIMKDKKKGGLGWKQETVMKNFIKPMVGVLLDMRDAAL